MKFVPILRPGILVMVLLSPCVVGAAPDAGKPSLAWKETETSLALVNGEQTVWRLVYDKGQNKSYFHPLALVDGTVLTELKPADHVWHYAAWFSWKFINGVNYWEEDRRTGLPGGISEITAVEVHPNDDSSARIAMTLSYHPPGEAELLSEKRTLTVSAPDGEGSYHIDWCSEFAAKGKAVVLERTPLPDQPGGAGHGGYAGLSIRVAKANIPWDFLDSEGRVNDSHGKPACWLSHGGAVAGGREAALTMFDHPGNVGHPSRWFTAKGMPYFSPAVIFSGSRTLEPGEKLELNYRILVQARVGKAVELERQYARYAEEHAGAAAEANEVPHVHATMSMAPLEKRPVPPGFEKPDKVVEVGVRKGQMRYMVEQFTVKPESKVKLILANTDDMQHNIIVCRPGPDVALSVAQKAWMMGAAAMERQFVPDDERVLFASRIVGVGETDEIYFVAPGQEGDYPYVCSLPGHAFTMKGVMTVSRSPGPRPLVRREQPSTEAVHDVVVGDRPLVYRVIVDGASPRTISVGLPGGYNYVFNPVTCEVEFIWLGGFLNLQGERTGRGNGRNKILGTKFGAGSVPFPLRIGSAGSEPARVAFGGYLRSGTDNPVFHYKIDGVRVEQELRFAMEGKQLEYRIKIPEAKKPVYFLLDEDEVAEARASTGRWEAGVLTLQPDEARSFSVFINLDMEASPKRTEAKE